MKTQNLLTILKDTRFLSICFSLLFLLIILIHAYNLAQVPTGLYIDEISIGLNAATIADKGVDEFGVSWPTYFKAFGEYKNPVYIYTTAILFKTLGISNYILRFTSVLWYVIGLLGACLLVNKIFKSWKVRFFFLIALGFLPSYFTLSRIAFEAISQFGVFTWMLYLCFVIFEEQKLSKMKAVSYPLFLGLLTALSIYTYSTSRLLMFGFVLALAIIYLRKATFFKFVLTGVSTLVGLVPYVLFSLSNPSALTQRFNDISYLAQKDLNLIQKAWMFLDKYLSYWQLPFLVITGDSNPRHSIGIGGVIFWTIFIVAIVGGIYLVHHLWQNIELKKLEDKGSRFKIFLLLNLFISPFAAALTTDGPHLIRSLLIGVLLCYVACYGLEWLSEVKIENKKFASFKYLNYALLVIVFITLIIESYAFTSFFFNKYPSISVEAFGSAGVQEAIEYSIKQNPNKILLSNKVQYSNVITSYYSYVVKNPTNIPIKEDSNGEYATTYEDRENKVCYIYLQPETYDLITSDKYEVFHNGLTSVVCKK